MYFQNTNSAQRNVPVIQLQSPFNNQQYRSPSNQYFTIQTQPRPFQESPKTNNTKEQLDSLYINLRKENQTLKDKLQHRVENQEIQFFINNVLQFQKYKKCSVLALKLMKHNQSCNNIKNHDIYKYTAI